MNHPAGLTVQNTSGNASDVSAIKEGKTALGLEFGSTRIKAVLTDLNGRVLAIGTHDWENTLKDGLWTYGYDEIEAGMQSCYQSLKKDVAQKYGVVLHKVGAMGISAMMHGYIPLDASGKPLAPFQTWRNSNTQQAADALTELFGFNIPLRWTIAHLYQCLLDHETHVQKIRYAVTLASYMHYRLSGHMAAGVGDASGIFPIDSSTRDYDAVMLQKMQTLPEVQTLPYTIREVLPEVMTAGQEAGRLTAEGARLLDPSGDLESGVALCPPEGDAGTGMTATNSVRPRTGNVSAGTSTFAMVVLEHPLQKLHREIDMVTTPEGYDCAMSHANNGTTDLNAWVNLFHEFTELTGHPMDMSSLFELLYKHSLKGDPDCGGLMAYGYYSGEGVTRINEGRPLYVRTPDSHMNLANWMRSQLYTSLGAVTMGMDILLEEEHVKVDRLTGHGGLFKTEGVAQRYLSAAMRTPVTVMKTASEGGPWGMAVLALYMIEGRDDGSLGNFLDKKIFKNMEGSTLTASEEDRKGFASFMNRYREALEVEKSAVSHVGWTGSEQE